MAERGEARAEIVERDAAAEAAQACVTNSANSSRSCSAAVSVISTTRRLATARLFCRMAEAPLSHARSVAVRPEMLKPRQMPGCAAVSATARLEHVAVDEADEAELLDRGDEIARPHDAAVIVDHAQQAFVIIDRAGIGVDHRLIGEAQALVFQRALHPLAQGHAVAVAQALLVGDVVGHEAVAPGALGLGQRRLGARHHFIRGLGLLGRTWPRRSRRWRRPGRPRCRSASGSRR